MSDNISGLFGWRGGILLPSLFLSACVFLPDSQEIQQQGKADLQDWLIHSDGQLLSRAEAEKAVNTMLERLPDRSGMRGHLRTVQAVSGNPLVGGNRLRLLIDGEQTYTAMLAAIESAQEHVHLNAYIFSDEGAGEQFADALIAKAEAGVVVRLVNDAYGALDTPDSFFQKMADAGVQLARFNPLDPTEDPRIWRANHREHAKLLVVDGVIAFTGGINISSVYSSNQSASGRSGYSSARGVAERSWRDTHIQIEGPIVPYLQARFLETWRDITGQDLLGTSSYIKAQQNIGSAYVRMLDSEANEGEAESYALYLSAIAASKRRLWITHAYFSPNDELLQALKDSAKRGVDVRIILPAVTDSPLVYYASRSKYGGLLAAGVRIWEFEDRVLHAKTAVMDGLWSTVGSANLDIRSFIHNNELNVSIVDQGFAQQMESQFQIDLKNSGEITLQGWRDRGLLDRLKETGARALDYWL